MRKRFGAADLGIADIHTFAMLQIALILLVASMTAMLVFWALAGMG